MSEKLPVLEPRRHGKLLLLLVAYGVASLVHFGHNAEFIRDYPGLPATWTRGGVYLARLGMTCVGLFGWWMLHRNWRVAGALVLSGYALLGLDSLGHYVVASMTAHSVMMNVTILAEVICAASVLMQALKLLFTRQRFALTRTDQRN